MRGSGPQDGDEPKRPGIFGRLWSGLLRRRAERARQAQTQPHRVASRRSPGSYPVPEPPETPPMPGVLRYFTAHEARTVEALTARILPSGPDGFGAREAGVLNYIDYLLAQADAFGQPIYRRPPYARIYEGEVLPPLASDDSTGDGGAIWVKKEDLGRYGFQSALDPQQIYRRGLAALDRSARIAFAADFADLPPDAQDDLVRALADDSAVGFDEPGARLFFEVVEEHTSEGAFSDPQYGGNLDKVGWKAIRYPAAQRTYSAEDIKNTEFDLAPQALSELHHIHARMPAADEKGIQSTLAMAMPLTPSGYQARKSHDSA